MRDINITPIQKVMIDMLDRLSKRDMEVLRFRFIENKTQEEVGQYYKVTRERIRQIEDMAMSKINKTLSELLKK